jgi:digeranylgeranylglycerophospholipid reductase
MLVQCWVVVDGGCGSDVSSQNYDVIVIGAGPAGSWLAYELASFGHSVAVFEQKRSPGLNVCCTGMISTECFNSLGVSREVVLTAVNSARFFSPSGKCLRVQTEETVAYVVDRSLLDGALARKAQSEGAQYFLSSRVVDLAVGYDGIQVGAMCSGVRELFTARAAVLASGFGPALTRKLGLGRVRSFLIGAQAEVETNDVSEVELYLGGLAVPGSFAWRVPASEGRSYVGLLAASHARAHLRRFLNSREGGIRTEGVEIRQKAIPMGTLSRTYGDRLLVVGDTAGHAKPTTGGGIYFGNVAARIAAQVLDEALRQDKLAADRLGQYERLWKERMGKELSRGYLVRRLYAGLSDSQIERIFCVARSTDAAEALVRSGGLSFDWHSGLVLAGLRYCGLYPWLRMRRLTTARQIRE